MPHYPYQDGDTYVLGPEVFAAKDSSVISWRGVNYYASQPDTTTIEGRLDRLEALVDRLVAHEGPNA